MKIIYFSSKEELLNLLNQNVENDVIFKNINSDFYDLNKCHDYFDSNIGFLPI